MLLLVLSLLLINFVTCSTVEGGTTGHDPRSGKLKLASNCEETINEQETIIHNNEAKIQELENKIQSLSNRRKVNKNELNCQRVGLVTALYVKDSPTKECMIIEGEEIQLNAETFVLSYINRIKQLEENEEKYKNEKEMILSRIIEKIEDLGQSEIYTSDKDAIIHKKEAQIQALEIEIKSLQEGHQMEKEIVVKENRNLQNQINLLKKQVARKEAVLQESIPNNNKEGIWQKYEDGDLPEDAVLSNDGVERFYVCRAEVDGEVLPGHVWSQVLGKCIVLHNGDIHFKSQSEVLVNSSSFKWSGCHEDDIPPQAVPGGRTREGEVVFIGRIKRGGGNYHVGKVQPSLMECYNYGHLDRELIINVTFQILVWK